MILRHDQQTHEVGVNAVGHWKTIFKIPKKPKKQKEKRVRDLLEWSEEFTDYFVSEEVSVSCEAP